LDEEQGRLEQKLKLLQRQKLEILRKMGDLRMMNQTFKDINSSLDLQTVLQKIVDRMTVCIEAESGSVMLLDDATETLRIAAAKGIPEDIVDSAAVPLGQSISGWVAARGEALLEEDVEKDPRVWKKHNPERYSTKSLISAPLINKGKVIGVINVSNRRDGEPFDNRDLDLLLSIANQASIAIENARLYAAVQEEAGTSGPDAR
jgi:GAF domain-containing protein